MKMMLSLSAVVFMFGTIAPAYALTPGEYPVHVTTCQPSRNVMVSGGFVPGYYPRGAYYWPSVYGYSYYQPPVRTQNPTLAIDYRNVDNQPMKQIEFGLVANGNVVAEVKDVGTFSPGAEIKHEFGLSSNVFPLSTSLVRCVPLKITYEDGSKWRNPRLPHRKHHLGL